MNHDLLLDSTYLIIGTRRQFFFDDLLLEQVQNLTRRFHHPKKVEASPVLRKDRPWESVLYFTCNAWSVIRDPQDGLLKCWYEDWQVKDLSKYISWVDESTGKLCLDFFRSWPARYLYAQSADGLTWEKPGLGIVTEDGRNTNVVLGQQNAGLVHCAYVLLDPLEHDESQRFKMVFEHRRVKTGDDVTGSGSFRVASSGDGISWRIWDQPIGYGRCGPVAGDVVTVSVDTHSRIYMANNRHPRMCSATVRNRTNPADAGWSAPSYPGSPVRETRRRIFRSESPDLIHWSTPTPLVVLDSDMDNIDDELYGMEQFQIGEDWLGLLNVFHNTDNTMDVQLAYSRNGRDFKRIKPGQPWLSPGPAGSWDQCMVTVCSKPVVVGDELFVFHGGSKNHHDWWQVGLAEGLDVPESNDLGEVDYALGLAKMKVDRFVSLAANRAREGILITRPVVTEGGLLVVNATCHERGYVQVAVADGNGNVLPGYERENCVTFTGDAVSHQLRWREREVVPNGGFLKLQFFLRNAELFSFQFIETLLR